MPGCLHAFAVLASVDSASCAAGDRQANRQPVGAILVSEADEQQVAVPLTVANEQPSDATPDQEYERGETTNLRQNFAEVRGSQAGGPASRP